MFDGQLGALEGPVLEAIAGVDADGGERIAVFDADGTIWGNDAAEALMHWIDQRALIPPPEGSPSLLEYNYAACAADRARGYSWGAEYFAGHAPETVAEWSAACFEAETRNHIHAPIRALIAGLMTIGWEVYVVSASPVWVLYPGTDSLGVPRDRVEGLNVLRKGGLYTDVLDGELTSGPGKAARIKRVIGKTPAIVVGNTTDDIPMMKLASHLSIMVNPLRLPDDDHDTASLARDAGFFILDC